jgi:hypothetical protein
MVQRFSSGVWRHVAFFDCKFDGSIEYVHIHFSHPIQSIDVKKNRHINTYSATILE